MPNHQKINMYMLGDNFALVGNMENILEKVRELSREIGQGIDFEHNGNKGVNTIVTLSSQSSLLLKEHLYKK